MSVHFKTYRNVKIDKDFKIKSLNVKKMYLIVDDFIFRIKFDPMFYLKNSYINFLIKQLFLRIII